MPTAHPSARPPAHPPAHPRRVTLADIARHTHTSVPTVSKVLHGRADVSATLRERIMTAIDELGYSGPRRAGGPGPGLPPLVDLVLSDVAGSWANRVLIGVERAAAEAGSDVVVSVAHGREQGWLTRLLARNLGGAVLALVDVTPAQLAALTAASIPIVLLDPVRRPPARIAGVGATNWQGGRTAAEHLVALGHRRIAVIAGSRTHLYSQARVDGFRSGLADAGVELPDSALRYGNWREEDAAAAAAELLAAPEPPTAIFACSDAMALGVYGAAADAGLRIPADLSVIGFDDLPESRWASPQLSTVRQPITEMGEAALRLLGRIRAGTAPAGAREELSTSLVVRDSTGPAAGSR